jgi:hypothetical protein
LAKAKKVRKSSILYCTRCGYRWAVWAYSFYWHDRAGAFAGPVMMATKLANKMLYIENLIDKCNYLTWWLAEDDGKHGVAAAEYFEMGEDYDLTILRFYISHYLAGDPALFWSVCHYPRYAFTLAKAKAKLRAWCRRRPDLPPKILQKIKEYKTLSSGDLWPVVKPLSEYRTNPFGPSLGPRVGEYVRQRVSANIDAIFKARKAYAKHPELFTGRPGFPGLYFDGDQVTIEVDKKVVDIRPVGRHLAIVDARKKPPAPPRCFPTLSIPIWNDQFLKGRFKTVKVKPVKVRRNELDARGHKLPAPTDLYKVSICYEKKVEREVIGGDKWLGINLGGKVLAACARNDTWDSFLISAIPIQNANEYAVHRVGELQRKMMQKCQDCPEFATWKWTRVCKMCPTNRWTRVMYHVREWRANLIETYCHQASNYIIQYCVAHDIGHIVVGHNPGIKQGLKEKNKTSPEKHGHVNGMYFRRVRRMFAQVPLYGKFLHQLQYKGEAAGVEVLDPLEMDVSLASALDLESVGPASRKGGHAREDPKHRLFCRPNGQVVHKDINAALNLLRTQLGDVFITELKKHGMSNPRYVRW